jgi:rRNA-processing protein FCF1
MKDCTIEILNVGAVKDVKLNLNKINIFMGEQSSGKSTIAKIVSFCSWVEKDVSIRQSFDNYSADKKYFIEKLETFHKMKGYFKGSSEIIYQSKTIKLHYKSNDFNISWVNRFDYKKNKISYIPSERTIAVLPEMEKVELPNNYIKSFLFDWFDARKNYSNDRKLSMLNIGIDYYYSESNKETHIQSQNDSYDILLSHASSGLQSMTPLMVMIDHLINNIYSVEQDLSYELDEVKSRVTQILITELIITPLYGKEVDREDRKRIIGELNKKLSEKDERITRYFNKFKEIRDNLFKIHSTNLIIEEPEQNLFPETQKKIIYHLLGSISSKLEHNLTLTTHSPYVLYAINNCIMAYLVNEKLSDEERKAIPCINSKIDPKSISIYQITDGLINCIQQDDGLIGNNFFDEQMKAVMDEFYLMLNHY